MVSKQLIFYNTQIEAVMKKSVDPKVKNELAYLNTETKSIALEVLV